MDVWISLIKGNKIISEGKWKGELYGRRNIYIYHSQVWWETGEMDRWPWEWIEICSWQCLRVVDMSRICSDLGYRTFPIINGGDFTWDSHQEFLWWIRNINSPAKFSSQNLSCPKNNAGTWDGAETEGMISQQQAQLDTHPMGKHRSLTVLIKLCYACKQKPSMTIFWQSPPRSWNRQIKRPSNSGWPSSYSSCQELLFAWLLHFYLKGTIF